MRIEVGEKFEIYLKFNYVFSEGIKLFWVSKVIFCLSYEFYGLVRKKVLRCFYFVLEFI